MVIIPKLYSIDKAKNSQKNYILTYKKAANPKQCNGDKY